MHSGDLGDKAKKCEDLQPVEGLSLACLRSKQESERMVIKQDSERLWHSSTSLNENLGPRKPSIDLWSSQRGVFN